MSKKYVYLFSEGNGSMRELLGGKGANLAEMTNLGMPVPQGFTITTEACTRYHEDNRTIAPEIEAEIYEYLGKMEEICGKKFGDPENPLLVSVRSGARASMPGMMDTILNLGLNDTVAEGHVIYTTPGVGETADVGSTVTIYVSSGPAAPKEYDVQNVVGWTYAEAYAALTNQGFSPVLATGNSAEGIVSSQSVTGTAPKGAEIVLTTRTPDTGSGDGEGTDGETEGNGAQGITGLSANTGA